MRIKRTSKALEKIWRQKINLEKQLFFCNSLQEAVKNVGFDPRKCP